MATRKSTSVDIATIVDTTTSETYIYIGKAERGSLESSAVWTVQRIDKTNGALIEVANGGAPDQIWDNRASLTYSL